MDIENILNELTLEEKASLCSGYYYWHTKAIERMDIPSVMMVDGPHGLRKQVGKEDHMGLNASLPAVCFPSAAALAASFDREVLKQLGSCLGEECQAENVGMLLGPGLNIKRSPLCGRNFEYFSEDPYLTGELAAAYVKSIQEKGVAACAKHFACNNQETNRMSGNAQVDERTLHELYLPAFEKVVKEAGVRSIMCAYNALNGTFCSENQELLTNILRIGWGYEGFVVTDWGAVKNRVKGLQAGLDLEMPGGPGAQDNKIVKAVQDGQLEESVLDEAVKNMLVFIRDCVEQKHEAVWDYEEDHKTAVKLAGECMVLLENRDAALPLNKDSKTAFIGAFATEPRYQGGGSSHVNAWKVTDAFDTAKEMGADVVFAKGYDVDSDPEMSENDREKREQMLVEEAIRMAKEADTAVIFAGLPDSYETEGEDRQTLDMPPVQNRLIEAVAAVQPNTVVVLHAGAPVVMPWREQVKGILFAYLCGEGAGEAEAAILYGKVNPSGKLAETFPYKLSDNPSYFNFPGEEGTSWYKEDIFVGYRYYDKKEMEVMYPFGYGLSYTTFVYDDLKVSKKDMKDTDTLAVSCRVTNIGKVAGKEIVQLYVENPKSEIRRPIRELRGFEKVELAPGESKIVTFTLDKRAFAYYNTKISDWYVESGNYRIQLAASVKDIRLEERIQVEGTVALPIHYAASLTVGKVIDVEEGKQYIVKALMKYMHMTELDPEEQPDVDEYPEVIDQTIQNTMLGMPLSSLVTYGALREEQLESFLERMNKRNES